MQPEVGNIYEGKVTGITKFGAFVELERGVTGLVHISEVANTYVADINEHLKEGETVKVKVLSVGDDGKISLSIKKAAPAPERTDSRPAGNFQRKGAPSGRSQGRGKSEADGGQVSSFEDMLSRFKASSDERMGDIRRNMNNKRRDTSRKR
ncbi:MAG: S1 RNA-binding domain-containing protein [Oscillospiraceae bacterium]|nr:S1 RNA-binding domain-containing protein [Oscillospiraceae bacterium]